MPILLALVRKDLLLFLRNRRAVLMTVAAPILIAAFFGSLFGANARVSQLPIGLADEDRSPLSRQIVEAMRADTTIALRELPAAQAEEEVRAGRLRAAFTLPAGFGAAAGRAIFGGPQPEIAVSYDPSQATALPLVRGLLAQHVTQRVMQSAFGGDPALLRRLRGDIERADNVDAQRRGDLLAMFDSIARVQAGDAARTAGAAPAASTAPPASVAASASAASPAAAPPAPASGASAGRGGLATPFTLRETAAVGRAATIERAAQGYNSYAHAFAGMGVQFILMQGVEFGVALLLMRRSALWLRLRAAPLTRGHLLGSRLVSAALISAGVFAVLFVVAIAGFGVRILGSLAGLVAIVAAFSLMTAAFGLMIAAIGRSPEATRGLAILATLLLVMVGGAWVPSFLFPPWLQTVAAWTPTHWAVNGLDAMTWRGQPWTEAVLPTLVQLGFAALFAAVALWRFRWDE